MEARLGVPTYTITGMCVALLIVGTWYHFGIQTARVLHLKTYLFASYIIMLGSSALGK